MTRVILENVSKNFSTMEAVKNFNLAAEDKEFLILVGPFLDVENQPIRLPGLKSGVCSGLTLSTKLRASSERRLFPHPKG